MTSKSIFAALSVLFCVVFLGGFVGKMFWDDVNLQLDIYAVKSCRRLNEMTDECFERERKIALDTLLTEDDGGNLYILLAVCVSLVVAILVFHMRKR